MTTSQRIPQRYAPTDDDQLIYEWVKMQGKTQAEVARMYGINQSTVCRIIQRLERWQAHAGPRENGCLDCSERLRAQRWLTYERNELILASCLRIARELESFTELSKNTIRRPIDQPNRQSEIRTEGRTIDRRGVVARFLRLAFRINMDQLKLAELLAGEAAARKDEASADPLPLTEEELAAEFHQAALDAAEIAAARHQAESALAENDLRGVPPGDEVSREGQPPAESSRSGAAKPPSPTLNREPETLSSDTMRTTHNLHPESLSEIATTAANACTCVGQVRLAKNSIDACIIDCDLPPWPRNDQGATDQHTLAATAERS